MLRRTYTFLTRAQYDALVKKFPAWMGVIYPKTARHWGINGVSVLAGPRVIAELTRLLKGAVP